MKAGVRSPLSVTVCARAQSFWGLLRRDDGGDGAGSNGRLRTTAYWRPGGRRTRNGRPNLLVRCPTTSPPRSGIMAVAAGADDRFGSGDSKITTFRKLHGARRCRGSSASATRLRRASSCRSLTRRPTSPINVAVKIPAGPHPERTEHEEHLHAAWRPQAEVRRSPSAPPTRAVVSTCAPADADVVENQLQGHGSVPRVHHRLRRPRTPPSRWATSRRDAQRTRRARASPQLGAGLKLVVDRRNDTLYDCTGADREPHHAGIVTATISRSESGAKVMGNRQRRERVDRRGARDALQAPELPGGSGFWDKDEAGAVAHRMH